ncbi:hypothetical protein ID866_5496 [Astraeus odoratus]|nr:hypothetical protein ID866_5496 [Astraeus odoratus]
MDPLSALRELANRANRYSISLDGRVCHDPSSGGPLRGSTALVYRGILREDGTKVAIKVFHAGPPEDMDTLKCILREVHLWSKLQHPNIVRMFGISTEFRSTISIISDWMGMGDAHAYVQNTDSDPRPLLMDIASGLQYLHSHEKGPILHGDLKGPNVLISNDRRALLADFGYSILTNSSFSMTVEIRCGGSLPWTAPEILDDGCSISPASDVWSFGMTMLELFIRLRPYHECKNQTNLVARVLQGRLPVRPTMEQTCFRMTDTWWDLCIACWQIEPSSRPLINEIMETIVKIMVCPQFTRGSGF